MFKLSMFISYMVEKPIFIVTISRSRCKFAFVSMKRREKCICLQPILFVVAEGVSRCEFLFCKYNLKVVLNEYMICCCYQQMFFKLFL